MLMWLVCLALGTEGAVARQPQTSPGRALQPPALEFKEVKQDTKLTTSTGATFTVPQGWHISHSKGLSVMREPQKELMIALVEMQAPTVDDAIAQAWKRWKPDFARTPRTVRVISKPPESQGWDEMVQAVYEAKPEERRVILALARRKGAVYYVMLTDGANDAVGRLGPPLNTIMESLDVPGRKKESGVRQRFESGS
jgi:hypothetical protein